MQTGIRKVGSMEWEVPVGYVPGMRVPGRFYLSDDLAGSVEEGAVRQLANVATLPGIVKYSLAMPDIHWGYGFPIGGVAAFDMEHGIISPGGVGFDINCGVRLITTPLAEKDITRKRELIEALFKTIPTGVGAKSTLKLSARDLLDMMDEGAAWAVRNGYGNETDLEHCEENGSMKEASSADVSQKARQRGMPQCGTLGSGNHFLELQVVAEVTDERAAAAFGIEEGQICCMIHCGSRGLGHQVCTDHLKVLDKATGRYNIQIPDRQLACAPVSSPEGKSYLGAMAAAANYAWANRQMITHHTRGVFASFFGLEHEDMPLVYDVAHNVAKIEEHVVDGRSMQLCVHRKGATRAFGPGSRGIPRAYLKEGQPVIIPGSMGSSSYILKGTATAMEKTFGSTCHGAGRLMSRTQAKKIARGADVQKTLAKQGIIVKATSPSVIAEEAPAAYKPSSEVVRVVHQAGISLTVARLEPLGVIKG
jgi:tRNA-splicing ligase RtcB